MIEVRDDIDITIEDKDIDIDVDFTYCQHLLNGKETYIAQMWTLLLARRCQMR